MLLLFSLHDNSCFVAVVNHPNALESIKLVVGGGAYYVISSAAESMDSRRLSKRLWGAFFGK